MFEISAKSGITDGVGGDEIVTVDICEVSDDFWLEFRCWPSWFEFLVQALKNDVIFLFLLPMI